MVPSKRLRQTSSFRQQMFIIIIDFYSSDASKIHSHVCATEYRIAQNKEARQANIINAFSLPLSFMTHWIVAIRPIHTIIVRIAEERKMHNDRLRKSICG